MKTKYLNTAKSFIYRVLGLSLMFLFLSFCLSADTFTTVQDGNYNASSTWSSGNKPPNTLNSGHVVNINHRVNVPSSVGKLKMDGPATINVNNVFIFQSSVSIEIDHATATINVQTGVVILPNGIFELKQGVVTFIGGGVQLCNSNYKDDTNASGQGTYGTGYIYTNDGGVNDETAGNFSSNIVWCSELGGEKNLPSPENCLFFTADPNWDGCLDEDFYLSQALPTELVLFAANYDGHRVQLHWETASEINNAGFEIERSLDARHWEKTSFVLGKGTALGPQSYGYIDKNPQPGTNYYRLKQLDFDGAFEYSKVVSVDVGHSGKKFALYPNPVSGFVNLAPSLDYMGKATFVLFNLTGRQIMAKQLTVEEGGSYIEINLQNVPIGVYVVELRTESERWKSRLVVE